MGFALMPFPVPVLSDLITQSQADFQANLGATPQLRRSVTGTIAKMASALCAGVYQYVGWAVVNVLMPDTATGGYQDRQAAQVGIVREQALTSSGSVTFTGSNGLTVPAGAQLQDPTGAIIVATGAAVTITGGTATVAASSVTGGSAANLAASTPLTLLVGIAGINASAVVAAAFTGGTDTETDAALAARATARRSLRPQGGAEYDYVSWAQAVPGVTRVWVYPLQTGANNVTILFVMDGRTNIIPLNADVANVQAAIYGNGFSRPVTAKPVTLAPTPNVVNIAISDIMIATGYTLASVKANIETALATLFAAQTPGGYGWDSVLQGYATGGVLKVEQIETAIGNAAGVVSFDLTAPSTDIAEAFGVIPQLGPVVYS